MNCKASWFRRPGTVFLALLAASVPAFAQKDLVKWSLTIDPPVAAPGATVLAKLEGRVDPGWHMYSFTPVKGANIPTALKVDSAVVADYKVLQPPPKRALDPSFNKELETYEGAVAFLVRLQIKKDAPAGPAEIALRPRYQVC